MDLDPDLWRRARPLLDAALDLPADAREAYLDQACHGDPALRGTVAALVAAAEDERPFLDSLPRDAVADLANLPAAAEDDGTEPGQRIGPYRILRLLGAGGMGAVYLARRDDGQFEQQVALKLIRAGPLSHETVARFRRERQILAWLNHPTIARLLDGGVSEAGPYLVMEYVEGQPIDQYCDRNRLGIADRLRVFLSVCEAVDHAHKALVIHRDLKPANILVTAAGEVKLLDFGIARLLDANPAADPLTGAEHRLLTREYASPEQFRNGPLTTATDGYALGAVLYQLLTGRLPHDLRGLSAAAAERAVCDTAPARPSTIRRELRGDLDTILLRALHPDPARRYGSAAALADDLVRHLERRPVSARADTLTYRLGRFVRRNAMSVAAAAAILILLVGGALATAYQGARAQRRFDNVRTLAHALLFDLHDAIRDLPGATPAREALVSHALDYLDQLRADAPSDPALQLELAAAYDQIGEIQGNPHRANLGDLAGAMTSYGTALALREVVWRRDSTNAAVRHALGVSYGHLAVVTSWSGRNDEAIRLSQRGIDLLTPLHDAGPGAAVIAGDLGRIESELGWWLIWAGQVEQGMAWLDRAVGRLTSRGDPPADDADAGIDLWRAYSYQVDGYRFTERPGPALALLETTALPHLDRLAERHPTHPAIWYSLHVCHDFIGAMLKALGRPDEARPAFLESQRMARRMVEADSANQKAFEGLARSHGSLGDLAVASGRLDAAIGEFEAGVAVFRKLFDRNPRNVEIANMLGNAQRRVCEVLRDGRRPHQALDWCLASEQVLERVVSANTANAVVRANLGSAYVLTARAYRDLAATVDPASAARFRDLARSRYRDGLQLLRELDGTDAIPEFRPDSVAAEMASLDLRGRPPDQ